MLFLNFVHLVRFGVVINIQKIIYISSKVIKLCLNTLLYYNGFSRFRLIELNYCHL